MMFQQEIPMFGKYKVQMMEIIGQTFLLIIIMVLHLGVTVIKFFCIVEAEMIILRQARILISDIV